MNRGTLLIALMIAVLGLSAQEIPYCKFGQHTPIAAKTAAATGDSVEVIHYDIRLNILNLAQKEISGYTEIKLLPEYLGMQVFSFDLDQLIVDSVLVNQLPGTFSYSTPALYVISPLAYNPTDTVRIRIYYRGNPVTDPGGFGGFTFTNDTAFAYNLGVGMTVDPHNFGRCWYPCKDNFVERATYEFHIRTSTSRKAVCNGLLLSDVDNLDGTHTMSWALRDAIPTYLSCVAVSNYIRHSGIIQASLGPVPFDLYVNPTDSLNAVNSFARLDTTVKVFEQYWGPYRWERVGYVSVPFNGGAMEHATSIAYPRVTINGNNTFEWLYAHELAHSWFGNLVTCETAGDMWLNEGFAAWSESFFYEKLNSVQEGRNYARQNHKIVLQLTPVLDGGFYAVSGIPHAITYGSTVYDRGASVAQTLRHYIGDNLYFPALQQYMDLYKFRHASSDTLRLFLEQQTGFALSDFFNAWVYNAAIPHFSIDSTKVSSDGNGGFDVEVSIRQRSYGGSLTANSNKVEIGFYDASMNAIFQTFSFSGAQYITSVNLPFQPVAILLDPNEKLMDAATDEVRVIRSTGASPFSQGFCTMNTQAITDSALIQVAHNWVSPDQNLHASIAGVQLASRYWKIDGVFPSGFSAKMNFTYDGRTTNTNSTSTNFLDNTLITHTEDSLMLLYRPGPGYEWMEVNSYTRNSGNLLDKFGNFSVDSLLKGEYTLGMKPQFGVSRDELKISQSELLKVFPNPVDDRVNIEFQIPSGKTGVLRLLDVQGRELRRTEVFNFQSLLQWDMRAYPTGVYTVELQREDKRPVSKKLIVP
jgi:aminopeptidase N